MLDMDLVAVQSSLESFVYLPLFPGPVRSFIFTS